MSFTPQMEPWFDGRERAAMDKYMSSGGWLTEFRETQKLEGMLADYTGSKECALVNNGTVSLTLMALACGVKAGDEVISPNFTMIASPNSVGLFGAKSVFVDVEPETLCMDIDLTRAAITDKTKAIMFVPTNGRYPKCGIGAFEQLCEDHGLIFMEDSAQSLGSYYPDGRHQGSVGKAGSFSFSMPKIITTGQGGAVVTSDEEVNYKMRRLKDFGRARGGIDIHDMIGYNFKFTDMQAVIGQAQMETLDKRVEMKKVMLKRYHAGLADCPDVSFFDQDLEHTTPWFIDVLLSGRREELVAFLKEREIGTRLMYPPINKQLAYQVPGEHPVSNKIGANGLWLPSQAQLPLEKIDEICGYICEFYKS